MSPTPVNATNPPNIIALIVAAGRGRRAGGGIPKQYRMLDGQMILARAIHAFKDHPAIRSICVVIHPDDKDLYLQAVSGMSILSPVHGGATRQESVKNGLEALVAHNPDMVLIHDAARCFLSASLLDRIIAATDHEVGAIPALAVTDTLKRAEDGLVTATVSRDKLWRAQTPQAFPYKAILDAHRKAGSRELTDDASVAEAAGLAVRIVEGDAENIKLTMAEDFKESTATGQALEPRTGSGFDVHRFEPGDHVWLCGIKIPHGAGLKGHSDADVGLHALTDAILGALADGDIGTHFPPSDPKWRGASSDRFLAHAGELVRKVGGQITHCDVTLICERPRIGSHKQAMRDRIAAILGLNVARVSVKATTTEQLGFTGREEGIAAQAIATLLLPEPKDQ